MQSLSAWIFRKAGSNVFGEERVTRFANDRKGRAKFLAWLRKLQGRPIVGFEPSGGYERPLIKTLLDRATHG